MDNRLIEGDCIDVLREMETTVDAVITDPPYGIAYQSSWRTDKSKRFKQINNDARPYIWWLPYAFDKLRDGGCILCFCRWDVQEAFRLALEWAGFTVKSQIIWDRQIHGMGDLTGSPAPQHDVIWFATKGKYKLPGKRPKSIVSSKRLQGDQLIHPTEKPVDLLEQLIESYTAPGEIVLDPFAGSGSTLVAAANKGRKFLGIEMDKTYFEKALHRIA